MAAERKMQRHKYQIGGLIEELAPAIEEAIACLLRALDMMLDFLAGLWAYICGRAFAPQTRSRIQKSDLRALVRQLPERG
jgi:hypothetical protein